MIRISENTILEDYFIDENGVITDKNGIIQKTYLNQGRPVFKNVGIHRIMMYTFYGYRDTKIWDIHHIDGNKLNNILSNLIYLTKFEHISLHNRGKVLSEEHKQKIAESLKGRHHSIESKQKIAESLKGKHYNLNNQAMKGKHHSEKTKQKMSEYHKGMHWFNNGNKEYFCRECPVGCIPGRIKKVV